MAFFSPASHTINEVEAFCSRWRFSKGGAINFLQESMKNDHLSLPKGISCGNEENIENEFGYDDDGMEDGYTSCV
jgi:hypothetical protein